MAEAKVFHQDDRVVMVHWQNVGIVCWREAPEPTQMRVLGTFSEALHRDHPDGYGFFNVVASGTPRFSSEVRAEGKRVVQMTTGWDYGTAHVILLRGFLASTVRSFLSTLLLVSRASQPTKVFGDLEGAISFIHERMGPASPGLSGLATAVQDVVTSAGN